MSTQIVTLLFCDLVGSTELLSRLADERGNEVRRDHLGVLRDAVGVHGGQEVKSLGDGLMVSFPSASEAVAAAAAMQRSIARLARRDPSVGLALRVGISLGEASLEDGDWFGPPVVEAARLCAAARPGQILVNDLVPTIMRSGGDMGFDAVGALSLKGLPGPVSASSVLWELRAGFRPPLPDALDTTKRFVFVGRTAEMATLADRWRRVLDGEGDLVLLTGEPGVGKTRLAAELGRRVHNEGALVLYGRCDEELGVPYQPFVEALRGLIAGCPADELRDFVAGDGPDLAPLLPVVAERLALAPRDDGDEPELSRYRMFEAVTALVSRVALSVPVLLVLDDLQWAAKPTLLLLRHVARAAPPGLFTIGTFRDTDLGRTHPLAGVLAELRRERDVQRLELEGLGQADVNEFVEIAAGHAFDASIVELAKAIYVETEGNPFFVGQLLRHLRESGALVQRDGRWSTSRPLHELGIPEGVRELIGRRLSCLSAVANDILGAASVIGRTFDTSVLAAASGAGQDEILDAIAAAEAARLIALVPGRLDRYTFVHALMRSTLYQELPTSRRLRMHRRVGLELEARGGGDSQRWAELAGHFCEAASLGEIDRAVHYSRLAGRHARAGLAFEEAVAHYQGALDALELRDEPDRVLRADLKLALGNAMRRAGDEHFREVVLDVVGEARAMGEGRLLARAVLGLTGSDTNAIGPVDTMLVGLLEEAVGGLAPEDTVLRAQLLGATAVELLWDPGQHARRVRLSDEAIDIVRTVGDRAAVARVLTSAHWGVYRPDNLDKRLALANELVALADDLGLAEARLYGHMARFSDLVELGEVSRADADLAAAEALAGQLQRPLFMGGILAYAHAGRALLAGKIDEARQATAVADEAAVRHGVGDGVRMNSECIRFLLLWEEERLDDALAVVEAMLPQGPAVSFWHAVRAALLVEDGRTAEARRAYERSLTGPSLAFDPVWLAGMFALASTASSLGDSAGAARLQRDLEPFAGRLAWTGVGAIGPIDLALARLHATTGNTVAAEQHFSAAASQAHSIGAPQWLARTRKLAAQALGAPGSK